MNVICIDIQKKGFWRNKPVFKIQNSICLIFNSNFLQVVHGLSLKKINLEGKFKNFIYFFSEKRFGKQQIILYFFQ